MRVLESQLRKHIKTWPEYSEGKVSFVEPGMGADTGISDCLFAIGAQLTPVELKRGRSVVTALRPSQRAWHRALLHSGVPTYGLTLTNAGLVLLQRLSLAGGLMSELKETQIAMWHALEHITYENVTGSITTDYS